MSGRMDHMCIDTVAGHPLSEKACAKLNLTLEICGRRPDGYHHLRSLVAFAADIADTVVFTPGQVSETRVAGPTAASLDAPNIVDRILHDLAVSEGSLRLGSVLVEKRIPVSAGLGGGSADAAALLRAIAKANRLPDAEAHFSARAAKWGADIPVCLGAGGAAAAMMAGIGEVVWRPTSGRLLPPDVFALLVNPVRPVSTADVFRRLAATPLKSTEVRVPQRAPFETFDDLLACVRAVPNDLEAPALAIEPGIADVLRAIAEQPGCRLARMSGSGATCFGLFSGGPDAEAARARLALAKPAWWVRTSRLN
jgi:4-diphosphocytidyl-2-C-methyl-D-erythritol kinase